MGGHHLWDPVGSSSGDGEAPRGINSCCLGKLVKIHIFLDLAMAIQVFGAIIYLGRGSNSSNPGHTPIRYNVFMTPLYFVAICHTICLPGICTAQPPCPVSLVFSCRGTYHEAALMPRVANGSTAGRLFPAFQAPTWMCGVLILEN
jgi:hypothetical protein